MLAGPWRPGSDAHHYRRCGALLAEAGVTVHYLADVHPTPFEPWDTSMTLEQWPTSTCRTKDDWQWVRERLTAIKPDLVVARFGAIHATLAGAAQAHAPRSVLVLSRYESPGVVGIGSTMR